MADHQTERQIIRTYWQGGYRYQVTIDCLGTERHSIIGEHKR